MKTKDLVGGPGGVRTLDLMTASHARSQLRHRPKPFIFRIVHYCRGAGKAGISGLCERTVNVHKPLGASKPLFLFVLTELPHGLSHAAGVFVVVNGW